MTFYKKVCELKENKQKLNCSRNTLPKSVDVVVKKRNAKGDKIVTGGPALKRSQAYPSDFGKGVAAVYMAHKHEVKKHAAAMVSGDSVNLSEVLSWQANLFYM